MKKVILFSIIIPIFIIVGVILNPPQKLETKGIVKVEWSNDRGGYGVCNHWYDSGLNWKWDCKDVSLQPGRNVVTVTATNTLGKKGIDTLVVNKQ